MYAGSRDTDEHCKDLWQQQVCLLPHLQDTGHHCLLTSLQIRHVKRHFRVVCVSLIVVGFFSRIGCLCVSGRVGGRPIQVLCSLHSPPWKPVPLMQSPPSVKDGFSSLLEFARPGNCWGWIAFHVHWPFGSHLLWIFYPWSIFFSFELFSYQSLYVRDVNTSVCNTC